MSFETWFSRWGKRKRRYPLIHEAYDAGAAKKAAELTTLGPCGKHPKACWIPEMSIAGEGIEDVWKGHCTVCAELSVAIFKLSFIPEHLNLLGRPKADNIVTAVQLVEEAASWARQQIEERGRQNDELRTELAAVTKERDELKASFQVRVIELHIEQNGSGLPLKGYDDCSRHTFETCTSPKCITAREILFAGRKESADV